MISYFRLISRLLESDDHAWHGLELALRQIQLPHSAREISSKRRVVTISGKRAYDP